MTQQDNQQNQSDEKLYAGKFKTVEELENGYKNAATVYEKNKELEKKIDEFKTPDDYKVPANLTLDEAELNDLKGLARNSSLTQVQFDKLVSESKAKKDASSSAFENAKKEIGADKLSVLQDYVNKNYPPEIASSVLNQLIADKKARDAALLHRDKILNSHIPGINKVNSSGYASVTRDDMLKAREEMQKRPSDKKARDRYISLTAEYAHQNKS